MIKISGFPQGKIAKFNRFPKGLDEAKILVEGERRRNILFLLANHAGTVGPAPKVFLGYLSPNDGSFIPALKQGDSVNTILDHQGRMLFMHEDDICDGLEVQVPIRDGAAIKTEGQPTQGGDIFIKRMHVGDPDKARLFLTTTNLSFWREIKKQKLADAALEGLAVVRDLHPENYGFNGLVTIAGGILAEEVEVSLLNLQMLFPEHVHLWQIPDLGEHFLCQTIITGTNHCSFALLRNALQLKGLKINIFGKLDLSSLALHWHIIFNWAVSE